MAIEFNLLYRWHRLVPSTLPHRRRASCRSTRPCSTPTRWSSAASAGCFEDASTPARRAASACSTRRPSCGTRSRQRAPRRARSSCAVQRLPRARALPARGRFDRLSGDKRVQEALRDLYGSVDAIEFYPGLFAEDVRPNAVLPALIGRLVAIDAFSQAFTNPLLAPRVFNEQTFSPLGWDLIRTTSTLSDLLHRNIPGAAAAIR